MSSQKVATRLTHVYSISDLVKTKQALLQMTLAMRDAVSQPWTSFISAQASSMCNVEEAASLGWTQLHTSVPLTSTGPFINNKQIFKYLNDTSCSHGGHHWAYSHIFVIRRKTVQSSKKLVYCKIKAKWYDEEV